MRTILILSLLLSFAYASPIDRLLLDAAKALRRFMLFPKERIPPQLLKEARAIAIIPNMVEKGGRKGRRVGRGVILFQTPYGWSNPLFIKMYSENLGWQSGAERIDIVILFMEGGILQTLANGKELVLGIDLDVAIGPIGEEITHLKRRRGAYYYARSREAFVGVALAGSRLELDLDLYELFYKAGYVRLYDLFERKVENRFLKVLKGILALYSR
ncbi:MAG: lipid-binding SYLF domain-containing protein [Epsilonproteobacteria bacterium]|nr:hypothetical protein [Campylobacterota bacterium]NPA56258.1 lipid-binding SYLF domain-containing protein [Campylobacterota bacterium]